MGVNGVKCPACHKTLVETIVDSVTVDVCKNGCGGIWFDSQEFLKLENVNASAGEALLEVDRDESIRVDPDAEMKCLRCKGQPLIRHFASTKQEVELDECYTCGGIWLDAGELGRIQSQYATKEERDKAFQAYFDAVFGEELKVLKADKEYGARKTQRFAHMFRFLCPSYYVPGEQSWGAF